MFSDLIVAYLFLGGAGAGCCLVASVLALFADAGALDAVLANRMRSAAARPWRRFFAALYAVALGALLVGAICLMADLGRPDRLLLVLFQPAPTYLSFGAWAIVVCVAVAASGLAIWMGALAASRRIVVLVSVVAAVASAAVIAYTELMLSDMPAVPLWHTPWLVLLFALSALSCGIALALCAALIAGSGDAFASTLARLAKADAVLIVLEAVVGVFCLLSVWQAAGGLAGPTDPTGEAARASLEGLLLGPQAVLFWAGFALVGLAVPFAQDIVLGRPASGALARIGRANRALLMLGTAACVLFGGFVLRALVVHAALQPATSLIT